APPRPGSDAAAVAGRWRGPVLPFTPSEAARADLVLDAVFGAGLARDLDDGVRAVLAAARRLVAVDVPSGLDGATGQPRPWAPQAELTVTFFRRKPGHLLLPGRDLCGEVVLADIGLPGAVLTELPARCFANGPALWRLPAPDAATHKHSRGHVTILGGAAMTGAAILAADAARRAGAGLVTIGCSDPAAATIYRVAQPGALVAEAAEDALLPALLADGRRRVWLLGPGLPPDQPTRLSVERVLAAGRSLVADAGALSAFQGEAKGLTGAAILTPHAGEFAALFGPPGEDRMAAVRAAAAVTGAVVLLKGSDTIVAAPDGRAAINHNAPPWLATGGSGDVLAGIAAALLAQGLPAWDAACAAAWLQGEAARAAGPGLIAEDLPAQLSGFLRPEIMTSS
ncbi:MAG: NAD(P)H-hydrate dehydratase, partial [Acetobacteraceae bacterium]|nr:NAD(P)H-hydrate dehydratase [Acetobacteraceae bacterium]